MITLTIQYGPNRTERGTVTVNLMDLGGIAHEAEVASTIADVLLSEAQVRYGDPAGCVPQYGVSVSVGPQTRE